MKVGQKINNFTVKALPSGPDKMLTRTRFGSWAMSLIPVLSCYEFHWHDSEFSCVYSHFYTSLQPVRLPVWAQFECKQTVWTQTHQLSHNCYHKQIICENPLWHTRLLHSHHRSKCSHLFIPLRKPWNVSQVSVTISLKNKQRNMSTYTSSRSVLITLAAAEE